MKAYAEWGADKVIIDKVEPTHYVRNFLVLKLIKKYAKKYAVKDICEIGCGTGSLSIELGKAGFKVDASDLDSNAVNLARRFNGHQNITYSPNNVLELKNNRKYDLIAAIEVIEHIKDDAKALSKMNDALNDNGLILITVPIHEKYRREFDNRSGHIRRHEPKDFIQKIKDAGFDILHVRYFNFPFLWLWYFHIYLPYSDKKERKVVNSDSQQKKLPKWISIMNVVNKFFLVDLLFNSKKYSTNMLMIGKKRNNQFLVYTTGQTPPQAI